MPSSEQTVPAGIERYVLRRAAGACWLVDVLQEGETYRPPVQLNDTGAFLWEGLCRGTPEEELARQLAGEGDAVHLRAEVAEIDLFGHAGLLRCCWGRFPNQRGCPLE